MPLKLVPPRHKHPTWYIRGSYLNVKKLYRSTGTSERRVAEQALKKLKRDIESGAFANETGPTFADAMTSYLQAGGEKYPLRKLLEYFQDTSLAKIDQAAIDAAADALFPEAEGYSPATRNRQVYCPMSAILKHAGIEKKLKRPKGGKGKQRLHWLRENEALILLDAAETVDERLGALCTFLLYTGCRLSDGLNLKWADIDLAASSAWVGRTKNGEPRMCFLPPAAVASLANLTRTDDPRVFRLCKNAQIYRLLDRAEKASGVTIPPGISFHIFSHTWATWMRRVAGLDTSGLVATGRWKSHEAARVYEHLDFSEEATKATLLPVRKVK